MARFGVEIGTEAAAEAMRVAWERWPEIRVMANPVGYLYRVGQSQARPHVRWWQRKVGLMGSTDHAASSIGSHDHDDLIDALDRLPPSQRAVLLLVRAHGYSYAECAAVFDITEAAVTNHLHRGTRRLREILERNP